jgi:hypothetical protein
VTFRPETNTLDKMKIQDKTKSSKQTNKQTSKIKIQYKKKTNKQTNKEAKATPNGVILRKSMCLSVSLGSTRHCKAMIDVTLG